MDDKLIKDSLNSAKIIAMVGVSSIKNENTNTYTHGQALVDSSAYLFGESHRKVGAVLLLSAKQTNKETNNQTIIKK